MDAIIKLVDSVHKKKVSYAIIHIPGGGGSLLVQQASRPRLYWEAEPDTLYTVMIEDVDVLDVVAGGNTGKHWLVTNIPG